MVNHLPNELVDCILDYLYFDKATLLRCALVGRAWVRFSQRGIFRSIALEFPHPRQKHYYAPYMDLKVTTHLIALFDEKPRLASYVRAFELQDYVRKSPTFTIGDQDAVHASTSEVIQRLTSLNQLSFTNVNWTSLSPLLKTALIDIFNGTVTRLSFTSFTIDEFSQLTSMLDHVTNLKVLRVENLHCAHHDWFVSNLRGSPPPRSIQLDKLVLGRRIRPLITWMQQELCPFGLQRLQSLRISPTLLESQIPALMLQQHVGDSITKLHFQCMHPFTTVQYHSITQCLGDTPNLTSITLDGVWQRDIYTPVPWIQPLFQALLSSEQMRYTLQRITIKLCIDHAMPLETYQWNQWVEFDKLLETLEPTSLRTVKFTIEGVFVPSNVTESLCVKLPFLKRSGKLKVSVK